jgi:hypothetical protein
MKIILDISFLSMLIFFSPDLQRDELEPSNLGDEGRIFEVRRFTERSIFRAAFATGSSRKGVPC